MITEEDMRGYLNNMLKFENEAKSIYEDLARRVSDEKVKTALEKLSMEETEHIKYIIQTRQLFKSR